MNRLPRLTGLWSRSRQLLPLLALTATPIEFTYAANTGQCGSAHNDLRLISQVQGNITDVNNDASPLLGQQVVLEALVTLDGQPGTLANGTASDRYNGFWIQEDSGRNGGSGRLRQHLRRSVCQQHPLRC